MVHCKDCGDFYCQPCDTTAHKTKKRRNHIRLTLSVYDLNAAALYVTRYVRRFAILKELQKRCRQKIRRYFDRTTFNHYYYNSVYGTVTWKKPYILRQLELAPFFDPYMAACKCQGLHRCWIARDKVRKLLLGQYKRIFDRQRGYFYYAYNGKSLLIPKSSWKKPRYCGKRSYPSDIPTVFTVDVAAVVIQRKWRAVLLRDFLRALTRASFEQQWDPVKGRWNYVNKIQDIVLDRKPLVMRKQPWDPNNVTEWSSYRVSVFLRRIGQKKLLRKFEAYGVDGKVFAMLDREDFDNMGITNRVSIKKIQLELAKIFVLDAKFKMSDEHAARREKIRRAKLNSSAACRIQKNFRVYLLRKELSLRAEIRRVTIAKAKLDEDIKKEGVWWINRDDIPSKLFKGDRVLKVESTVTKVLLTEGGEEMEKVEEKVKLSLPPIKSFGKRRDHLSCSGWGRVGAGGQKWIGMVSYEQTQRLEPQVASTLGNTLGIGSEIFHPSRFFTQRLEKSGYDNRRLQLFKGLVKDLHNPVFEHNTNAGIKRQHVQEGRHHMALLAHEEDLL